MRAYSSLSSDELRLIEIGHAEEAVTDRIIDGMFTGHDPLAGCGLEPWDTALVLGQMLVTELARLGFVIVNASNKEAAPCRQN